MACLRADVAHDLRQTRSMLVPPEFGMQLIRALNFPGPVGVEYDSHDAERPDFARMTFVPHGE